MYETPIQAWFHEARHLESIRGERNDEVKEDWRKIKDRIKSVSVALILCLNYGSDPPDVTKPNPCARREAWIDPEKVPRSLVSQKIAESLQASYERLQPRARYKAAIDPTLDYVRKLCQGMRKSAREDRVIFHFNGHGVPLPTESREIWVFNKNLTQYIPLSLDDLCGWITFPSVFIWDCNYAGRIVNHVNDLAFAARQSDYLDCIQLGACENRELLPTDADLPADLFSSCLTTPIHTSLLYYVLKNKRKDAFPLSMIDNIPGKLMDRKTLLGELNWIFTAITDTIAWSSLQDDKDKFQKLFRQDLLVACLFRSFLLAEKIMKSNGCRVVSNPRIPQVADHPLWKYWEYTIELCLINLKNRNFDFRPSKALFSDKKLRYSYFDCYTMTSLKHTALVDITEFLIRGDSSFNSFFVEQLDAFDMWLRFEYMSKQNPPKPPDQLPVILQVLLSQTHRVKALELLARFVDVGPWAVMESLSVGVFPYVLKLLQSGTKELRKSLSFIWAKILIVDPSCCEDLMHDGLKYFIDMLNDMELPPKHKIIPTFIICKIMDTIGTQAQERVYKSEFIDIVVRLINDPAVRECKLLCMWLLIGIGKLWARNDRARWHASRNTTYLNLVFFFDDDVPEVRAASVYAFGQLLSNGPADSDLAHEMNSTVCDTICKHCAWDGSVLVRLELVVAIQWMVIHWKTALAQRCYAHVKKMKNEIRARHLAQTNGSVGGTPNNGHGSVAGSPLPNGFNRSMSLTASSHSASSADLMASILSAFPPTNGGGGGPSDDLLHRTNLFASWRNLEQRSLRDPFERILVILLRLYFDPMQQVRALANILVDDVIKEARRLKAKDDAVNTALNTPTVKFVVGPPMDERPSMVDTRMGINERHRWRTTSSGSESTSAVQNRLETSSTAFTFKRKMYDPTDSKPTSTTEDDLKAADIASVVTTDFVEWSSKVFNKCIYDVLYDEGRRSSTASSDGKIHEKTHYMIAGEKKCSEVIPNDWALHTAEGVEQHADNDARLVDEQVERLLIGSRIRAAQEKRERELKEQQDLQAAAAANSNSGNTTPTKATVTAKAAPVSIVSSISHLTSPPVSRMEKPPIYVSWPADREMYSVEWSYLRPHVYISDGKYISVYNVAPSLATANHNRDTAAPLVVEIRVNEDQLFSEDPITDIKLVNGRSHELVIAGTRDGLISVWDPKYLEHDHRVEQNSKPKMLTSNHLFNDQTRQYPKIGRSENYTFYDWKQSLGRLLCGGNVPIVRIWDAGSENVAFDVKLEHRCGLATALTSTDDQYIIAAGHSTGITTYYDTRMRKPYVGKILGSSRTRVTGVGFYDNRLAIGYEDAQVKLYDWRMNQSSTDVAIKPEVIEKSKSSASLMEKFSFSNRSPVVQAPMDVGQLKMRATVFHPTKEVAACALNDGSVRLFSFIPEMSDDIVTYPTDPQALQLQRLQMPSSTPTTPILDSTRLLTGRSAAPPAVMRFHHQRIQLGVASKNVFSYFKLPDPKN